MDGRLGWWEGGLVCGWLVIIRVFRIFRVSYTKNHDAQIPSMAASSTGNRKEVVRTLFQNIGNFMLTSNRKILNLMIVTKQIWCSRKKNV